MDVTMLDSLAPVSEVGNTAESVPSVAKEPPSSKSETPLASQESVRQPEAPQRVEQDESARILKIQENLKAAVPAVVVDRLPQEKRAAEVVLTQEASEAGSPRVSVLTDGLTQLQRARREALYARHGKAA